MIFRETMLLSSDCQNTNVFVIAEPKNVSNPTILVSAKVRIDLAVDGP